MEQNTESEGLVVPMSRSEGLKAEDPELVEAVAEDKQGLKRKTVHSRSKANYQASKRRRRSLESLRKRPGGGSVRSFQSAVKKNRRSLEVGPPCSGTELNFLKSGVPDEENDVGNINIQESSDDSEPLINKIKKNSVKRAQNHAKQTAIVNNDTFLSTKQPKHASNASVFQATSERLNGSAHHVANSFEIGRGAFCKKHNFPGLKDFAKKSLRTSKKKKIQVSVLDGKDTLEVEAAMPVALPPVKAPNISKATTAVAHVSEHETKQKVNSELVDAGSLKISKATTSPSVVELASDACDHKTKHNLSKEVSNAATLKWSNHKARQNLSGSGNRTVSKRGGTNALTSQSGNGTLAKKGAMNALPSQPGNVVVDEQHSLEQNAARTLSSRFSSNGGAQKIAQPIVSAPTFNLPSGLTAAEKDENAPVQGSGRALRPRQRRQKPSGTKRYGEICFSDADAFQILNRRIKVFWPLDNKWYYGLVKSYDPTNKLHYVRYDDHDEEWLQLRDEKFKLQLLPGEADGRVKLLEKNGCEKVEGSDKDSIQSGCKILPSSELNNESQLGDFNNDSYRHRVEHNSFEMSPPRILDACNKSRDGLLGNGCNNGSSVRDDVNVSAHNDGSSLVPARDTSTEKSTFNNSNKKISGKVYVRKRYRNTSSKDDTGENLSGFQKSHEPVMSQMHVNNEGLKVVQTSYADKGSDLGDNLKHSLLGAGKNKLSGPFKDKSRYLQSVGGSKHLRPKQHEDDVEETIVSASITCKELSDERGFELVQINNEMNSSGYGFELLPRLTDSSGFSTCHFVFPVEVDFGNPYLSLWTTLQPINLRCGLQSVSCHSNLILRQSGVLNSVWPDAWLEILVADNFIGSSIFSLADSLQKVVNAFAQIMVAFVKPFRNQYSCMSLEAMKDMNFKVPIPSVSFRISLTQGCSNPLEFVFYDFQGITRARWRDLFKNLEALCSAYKYSSLQSPYNANSCFLESCSSHLCGTLALSSLVMFVEDNGISSAASMSDPLLKPREGLYALQDMNIDHVDNQLSHGPQFQKLIHQDIYQSASVCRGNGHVSHLDCGRVVPPFSITFAAAPSFFLGLHLKLLLGKPVTPNRFQRYISNSLGLENWEIIDLSEEGSSDVITVRDSSTRTGQTREDSRRLYLETEAGYADGTVFGGDRALDSSARLWQTTKHSKVDVDASPISSADGCVMSSPRSTYSELNVTGTSAGVTATQDKHESFMPGNVFKLRRCPTNRSSWRLTGNARPNFVRRRNLTVAEVEARSSFKDDERDSAAEQSFHGYFDTISGQSDSKADQSAAHADTLTGLGNYWSQEKYTVASSSKLWQDNRNQHVFSSSTEPRKRRGGYANLIFSEIADDIPFKYRGHMRRGRPSRQNREEKLKKSADNSSDLRYLDSVSCSANILVVGVDRGWRESGAQVILEASGHNEWTLSIKLHGFTKYTHKAQQVVQSGSTNRYTHAMLWKGGKDWSLEFPDRKQWALFKEMHEECYNRNLRAASVRHIPIPGVREIEDYDCSSDSFHFVRPSSRYIRQMESEVEMALATSRVMYDMDSEDEEWLGHLNNSRIGDGGCQPGHVSEETFERIMDLLEKAAFTQQRELLNSDEVADFCWDIATVEVVKAIHAHWQEKRWRKGMALVRHFQPASWERYQQQIKEWESQMNELQNSPTANKQQPNLERPPMFAFCLKPRGLEVPNKTQKQRSHRKFNAGQQITLRDQENVICTASRRHNGISIGEDTSSEALGIFQHSSPSEIDTYSQPTSFGAVSSEATTQVDFMDVRFKMNKEHQQKQKMKRKAKKMKVFVASKDPQQEGTSHCELVQLDHRKEPVSYGWDTSACDQQNVTSCAVSNYNLSSLNPTHPQAGSDFDAELRVQEAENAACTAAEVAAAKRARAERLLQKADLVAHKAVVAVVIAETIQASERDRQGETDNMTEESGRAVFGHWRPSRIDPLVVNDGTMRQSRNCSVPASLPGTNCFMKNIQADVMAVTTVGSSSIKMDSDSNQVQVKLGVEESLMSNDALVPMASWGHEINT
ncbi:uncharacterized protein LOC131060263 [Cryptomeria japonica]|uniref:uncharacterized protein LOC131060263 n=1 Tax=Cryptomeria japonica TaxID=3369 RepID=UPI0027D9D159|nr:uncharacterized protein LOC131060263 [Cryptomeria japonica]